MEDHRKGWLCADKIKEISTGRLSMLFPSFYSFTLTYHSNFCFPQHFLYFLPLPHGQGSFGYIFFSFTRGICFGVVNSSKIPSSSINHFFQFDSLLCVSYRNKYFLFIFSEDYPYNMTLLTNIFLCECTNSKTFAAQILFYTCLFCHNLHLFLITFLFVKQLASFHSCLP